VLSLHKGGYFFLFSAAIILPAVVCGDDDVIVIKGGYFFFFFITTTLSGYYPSLSVGCYMRIYMHVCVCGCWQLSVCVGVLLRCVYRCVRLYDGDGLLCMRPGAISPVCDCLYTRRPCATPLFTNARIYVCTSRIDAPSVHRYEGALTSMLIRSYSWQDYHRASMMLPLSRCCLSPHGRGVSPVCAPCNRLCFNRHRV